MRGTKSSKKGISKWRKTLRSELKISLRMQKHEVESSIRKEIDMPSGSYYKKLGSKKGSPIS